MCFKRGGIIYSPDHITTGHYSIQDIVDYFNGIREKWRPKFEEERIIKERVNAALNKFDEAFEKERRRRLVSNILKASNVIAESKSKSANYIIITK